MNRHRPQFVLVAALVVCGLCATARGDVGKTVESLATKLRTHTKALVGVHVVRLTDGKVLCGVGGDQRLIPASNQKILTSAVALHRLGAGFKFSTRMGLAGDDLVVIGDGDPTTGDPTVAAGRGEDIYAAFDHWAKALNLAGVKRVGNVIVRPGIFQGKPVPPDWPREQLNRWYTAPAAGLNFRRNCVLVSFKVSGKKALPIVTPASRFLDVESRVKVSKRHAWWMAFGKSGRKFTLHGSVSTTTDPYRVAVSDPAMFFAAVLAERLEAGGVKVTGTIKASRSAGGAGKAFEFIAAETTPLSVALGRANRNSLNLAAECLFLRSAAGNGSADWSSAAAAATETLMNRYGLKKSQFRVADGSGMSKRNLVTPEAVTSLLRRMAGEKVFLDSLAAAGKSGSMRNRLKTHAGRVLAKTGSLAGASALSGYVLDASGQPVIAFSIITNGKTWTKHGSAKGMENRICEALIRSLGET